MAASFTTSERLIQKLRQAEFFHRTLSNDQFRLECHFMAFLSAWKSIVYYARREISRKAGQKSHERIDAWVRSSLSQDQQEIWNALGSLRDSDIHDEPVRTLRLPGTFSARTFASRTFASRTFQRQYAVTVPETGKRYAVKRICGQGLEGVRRLIAEIDTI